MATQKILLPYNFSANDQKALDFVIRTFGHLQDAEITIFNAYTPVPELETTDNVVTGKLKSSLNYLSQKIMQQESELDAVKQNLTRQGISENRIQTIFKPRKKDIASEIIDLAAKDNFNVVVINHKAGRVKGFFTASVHNKIVGALKETTVCVVS